MAWLAPLNPPVHDWRGKRVWVVGASSGIGAALARALAARGARLGLSARSRSGLEAVALDCGIDTVLAPMDGTRAEDFARVCNTLLTNLGGIDLLVLCAGTYRPLRAWELEPTLIRETLDTNVFGAMVGVAAVIPHWLQRGEGAVALVGSVAGYGGLPNATVYGPSKAALINLAETLHLDLSPKGVGVYLINPGFVDTPLTAQNDFHMPALVTAEQAAQQIIAGFARGDFEIHFPRRFTRVLKLLQWLPRRWYFPLVRRFTGL